MMVGSTATLVGITKEMALWDTPFLFNNTKEADAILDGLETEGEKQPAGPVRSAASEDAGDLFSGQILQELASIDVMSKTPIEAMEILFRLSKEAKGGRS